MALRIVRKSVGLRPRTFGGGRSAEISSNSASDISVEYRSRMTSYFARSASFQGIANLPKLLQTRENQTPRGRATNFRSGQALTCRSLPIYVMNMHAARHKKARMGTNNRAGQGPGQTEKTHADREGAKPPGHVSQSCPQVENFSDDFSGQRGEVAGVRHLVRQLLRPVAAGRPFPARLQARDLHHHARQPDHHVRGGG